ncbi:MAG: aldo/keto reductase, partial [Verrucomicrobiota bacterium]|nr:aldo/keto reductase [Verrucomicrobiota bacterium]
MKYNSLGKTSLSVSQLAMGGLFVSAMGGAYEDSKKAVDRALALGVNYIDTAPGYANSEEVLGKILKDNSKPLVISTKLGGRPQPFNAQDKDLLFQSVEQSLKLLGRDSIDILMVHEPDRPNEYDWFTDFDNAVGPVMEVLEELKKSGVIKFTGLGGR